MSTLLICLVFDLKKPHGWCDFHEYRIIFVGGSASFGSNRNSLPFFVRELFMGNYVYKVLFFKLLVSRYKINGVILFRISRCVHRETVMQVSRSASNRTAVI